jgi:hypothetical protein
MKGQYATFIVRIQDESNTNFRGFIQYVRTQEEAHFDSFADMQAFMLKHLTNYSTPAQEENFPPR